MGPDNFRAYLSMSDALHIHRFNLLPIYPQGQGFIEATSVHDAGKENVPFARDTVMTPSSSGSRKDSITRLSNSGNSSKVVCTAKTISLF